MKNFKKIFFWLQTFLRTFFERIFIRWKSYIGILPRNFSTPLFIYYLKENGNAKIKEIASQLPIETKEKLLGQLDELIIFEEKVSN